MQYFTLTFALLTLFAVGSFAGDVDLLKRLLTELEMEIEERNEAEACVDNVDAQDCADYSAKDWCKFNFVKKGCKKSCNLCDSPAAEGECKDIRTENDCKLMYSEKMCAENLMMQEKCKKTCGRC